MRTVESTYLDPHHVGKDDADYTTGYEPTMFDDDLSTEVTKCCGARLTRSAIEEAQGCPLCQ
jgi:hypothetical protein